MAAAPDGSFAAMQKATERGETSPFEGMKRLGKEPASRGEMRRDATMTNRPLAAPDSRQAALNHATTGVSTAEPALNAITLRRIVLASTLILVLLVLGSAAWAANVYVLSGGAGNGSAWNNALSQLPSPMVRGNTYYIGNGTYNGAYTTVPMNGTNQIIIKKATLADHGTSTGWSDVYANQATFGVFWIGSGNGYFTIDGSYPYGFLIRVPSVENAPTAAIDIRDDLKYSLPNITIKYVNMVGDGDGVINYPWTSQATRGIHVWRGFGPIPNLLVSHCRISGVVDSMNLDQMDGMIIEYTELAWSEGNSGNHGNIIQIYDSDNVIFRYNFMHNYSAEGIEMVEHCSNWKVYGNVVYGGVSPGSSSRFIECYDTTAVYSSSTYVNNMYYNNTFIDLQLKAFYFMPTAITTGNQIKNNIFYNSAIGEGVHVTDRDYNWYSGSSANGEAHGVAGGANVPFINYLGNSYGYLGLNNGTGFNITSASTTRNRGVALSSEYASDAVGNVRGADGAWDMGAYEYGGGPGTNPVVAVLPGTLDFGGVLTNTSGTNLTLTVQNLGAGTLAGSATVSAPFQIVSGGTYSLGANQSQTVIVRFTPTAGGSTSQTVTFTGGGGATVTITGAGTVKQPGLSFNATSGWISAPLSISSGYIAQAVETGITDGGQAVYAFDVPATDNYVIRANVNAPDAAANSFYVNIDTQPTDETMVWDVPVSAGFTNRLVSWRGNGTYESSQYVPAVFNLTAGTHQLIIRGREAGTQLGQITIMPRPGIPQNLRKLAATP